MATNDLPDRVERTLRQGYGLSPPALIVQLHVLAAQTLAALVAGSSDILERARWVDDLLSRGTLFGPGLHLSLPLRALALPDTDASDRDENDGQAPEPGLPWVDFPELFEVASPRLDGITHGFVVHAPELALSDHPMAEWDPRGGNESIVTLGPDIAQGLRRLLSRQAACLRAAHPSLVVGEERSLDADGALARIEAMARALGFDLDPDAPATIGEPGKPPVPAVPHGYRFEPTRDGIGVLAPLAAFGHEHVAFVESLDDADLAAIPAAIELADEALDAGHPASALVIVREALHGLWFEDEAAALHEPMRRAYLALGRPLLADRVRR